MLARDFRSTTTRRRRPGQNLTGRGQRAQVRSTRCPVPLDHRCREPEGQHHRRCENQDDR